jgi:hypothetical protein
MLCLNTKNTPIRKQEGCGYAKNHARHSAADLYPISAGL